MPIVEYLAGLVNGWRNQPGPGKRKEVDGDDCHKEPEKKEPRPNFHLDGVGGGFLRFKHYRQRELLTRVRNIIMFLTSEADYIAALDENGSPKDTSKGEPFAEEVALALDDCVEILTNIIKAAAEHGNIAVIDGLVTQHYNEQSDWHPHEVGGITIAYFTPLGSHFTRTSSARCCSLDQFSYALGRRIATGKLERKMRVPKSIAPAVTYG